MLLDQVVELELSNRIFAQDSSILETTTPSPMRHSYSVASPQRGSRGLGTGFSIPETPGNGVNAGNGSNGGNGRHLLTENEQLKKEKSSLEEELQKEQRTGTTVVLGRATRFAFCDLTCILDTAPHSQPV